MPEYEYAVELAEAIDATMLTGTDAICLGPTDAALVSAALRQAAFVRAHGASPPDTAESQHG